MVDWQLRLRAALETQFTIILTVLVVLALLGGWLTYTAHAAPEPATEQQVTAWELTGNFSHSATVDRPNSLYEEGTTLTDQPIYFTRLSPQLDGVFSTSYDVRERGTLNQTVSLTLVLRSVEDDEAEEPTVYWERTEPLETRTVDAVDPGQRVRVPFSQNMSDVRADIERIRNEVGGSPGQTEVLVRATVRSTGTVNGNPVRERETFTLPVTVDADGYRVDGTDPTVESYETSQTVSAGQSGGPLQTIGGPALILIAIGSIGALTSVGREELTEADRALLAYEEDRAAFDEWISTIRLPEEVFDGPQAEAASLGELVDFAIDTNNSVIEDPDTEQYYVLHDDYLYTYRPSEPVARLSNGEHPVGDAEDTPADESPDDPDE